MKVYSMSRYYYRTALQFILLIAIVSQQSGVNVNTNITTEAGSNSTQKVNVNTNVNTSGSSSTVYKKVEVEVNGVKKVYESTEPGEDSVSVTSDKNGTKISVEKKGDQKNAITPGTKVKVISELQEIKKDQPAEYKYIASTFHDYLLSVVKNFFR